MVAMLIRAFLVLLLTLFYSLAYADLPKIFPMKDINFGIKAIGFSVFRGTEPQRFEVELRSVVTYLDSALILVRVSGGPMETPLEEIGAIAGMSGSPVFVNCNDYDNCINDGSLVGALSYRLSEFTLGGTNAALTSAEDMLGSHVHSYLLNHFSNSTEHLILDSTELLATTADISKNSPYIKPGSMISIFLAKGDINVPVSGTVTWRSGNMIYVFGHPLFKRGVTAYEFSHTRIADTLQTPLSPEKVIGNSFGEKGVIFIDGAQEVIGVVGPSIQYMTLKVELKTGNQSYKFNEQLAPNSEFEAVLLNSLSRLWAANTFGDLSKTSLYYKILISGTDEMNNERSLFFEDTISSRLTLAMAIEKNNTKIPFEMVFGRIAKNLSDIAMGGLKYQPKEISVYLEARPNLKVWMAEKVFLSSDKIHPGETTSVCIVVSDFPNKALTKKINIPVKIPENFLSDEKSKTVELFVQGGGQFKDKSVLSSVGGLADNLFERLNEANRLKKSNLIWIQLVSPKANSSNKDSSNSGAFLVGWENIDPTLTNNYLNDQRKNDVELIAVPSLDDIVLIDETLKLEVVKFAKEEALSIEVSQETVP